MMEKNEEDIEKKEEKNTINDNQENESENMRADKLTNIANTLVFTIPIFIWFINLICPINELIVILINYITPLSILSGLTLLVYIRIKYPYNVKSKKLLKTCIITAIVITALYCILFATCIKMLTNCEGMPG